MYIERLRIVKTVFYLRQKSVVKNDHEKFVYLKFARTIRLQFLYLEYAKIIQYMYWYMWNANSLRRCRLPTTGGMPDFYSYLWSQHDNWNQITLGTNMYSIGFSSSWGSLCDLEKIVSNVYFSTLKSLRRLNARRSWVHFHLFAGKAILCLDFLCISVYFDILLPP